MNFGWGGVESWGGWGFSQRFGFGTFDWNMFGNLIIWAGFFFFLIFYFLDWWQSFARSEIRGESENPFSQRFPQSNRRESKKILTKFSNLYSMSICENPQLLAKTSSENQNGFSHYVTNFYPCFGLAWLLVLREYYFLCIYLSVTIYICHLLRCC